mgnify:CR=1 FL=1
MDDTAYPYIKSISWTGRNDDWVNIDLTGQPNGVAYNWLTAGFPNYGTVGGRAYQLYFDTTNALYVSTIAGTIDRYYGGVPTQYALMWCDNRGGGPNYLYLDSNLVITYAISKTQTITHTFTTGSTANLAGMYMAICPMRAKLGLNSLLKADSPGFQSGIITPVFTSFTVS